MPGICRTFVVPWLQTTGSTSLKKDLMSSVSVLRCLANPVFRLARQLLRLARVKVHAGPAEWDPYADAFAEEEAVYENAGRSNTAGEAYDRRGDALVVGHTSSSNHRTKIDATTLARRWGTSVHTAENTLKASTTRAVRFFPKDGDFTRRFRTRQGQLRYPHVRTT
jgi:hypothetical protein